MPSRLLEKRRGEKEREEDREGTRLKSRLPENRECETSKTFLYYTGDALEMEQETRTREKEKMSDKVNQWQSRRSDTGREVKRCDGGGEWDRCFSWMGMEGEEGFSCEVRDVVKGLSEIESEGEREVRNG